MNIRTRAILAAGTVLAACGIATPAQAFLSPCLVLGSPMPPPCIVLDYKKLADIAQQVAHEKAKIENTISQVKEMKSTVTTIGSDLKGLAKIDIKAPAITGGIDVKGFLPKGLLDIAGMSIKSVATSFTEDMFAGKGATSDQGQVVTASRQKAAVGANVESYATSMLSSKFIEDSRGSLEALTKASEASTNLRGDFAVNSKVKQEVLRAQTLQNTLWATYLQQKSATSLRLVPLDMVKGYATSAMTGAAALPGGDDMWAKVARINALKLEASQLLGSLSVVQMSSEVNDGLNDIITDYKNTIARKATILAQFRAKAQTWVKHSGKGNVNTIMNIVDTTIRNYDAQMSKLRAQPIASLTGALTQRFGADGLASLTASDVDPRQFIGTWADPVKYDNMLSMANTLIKGSLDKYVKGDDDNDEFRQFFYDYNDVREEEAWKKVYADDATAELKESKATMAEEQNANKVNLNEANVTTRLQQIVSEANGLAQQISASTNVSAKSGAKTAMEELQETLSVGTSLPVVEIPVDPPIPAD